MFISGNAIDHEEAAGLDAHDEARDGLTGGHARSCWLDAALRNTSSTNRLLAATYATRSSRQRSGAAFFRVR
jgi:hypothetical protein